MQIRNMALCGMFSALLCIGAWLSFPLGDVAVTLQTLGVFLCLFTLGGRRGTIAIFVYLLLGAVGLPVFSGFRGGIAALLGATGGYLLGFFATGLVYWLLSSLFPRHPLPAMAAGLLACYCFGSIWYFYVYIGGDSITLGFIAAKCVLPFLLPDAIKLLLAYRLSQKLKPFVY